MTRRHLLPVTALAAVLLVVTALPAAGAIPPFGPIVTVAPAPSGCTIDSVNGDATVASGVIRGFFNFSGPGCDAEEIWFAGGFGTTWKVLLTPYRGRVLASDQSSGAFVLFSASTGIFLGERSLGNGTYLDPPRQLSSTAPGAVIPQGTVLAGPSNTWWAVWTEQVGPGGEFAQTELFQAKTYSNDLARTQVTNHPDNDSQPALAFRPGGGGELVFVRDDGFGNEPTHSYLRLATASGVTGAWTGSQFAAVGINTDPSIETTPGTTGHTYVAEPVPGLVVVPFKGYGFPRRTSWARPSFTSTRTAARSPGSCSAPRDRRTPGQPGGRVRRAPTVAAVTARPAASTVGARARMLDRNRPASSAERDPPGHVRPPPPASVDHSSVCFQRPQVAGWSSLPAFRFS